MAHVVGLPHGVQPLSIAGDLMAGVEPTDAYKLCAAVVAGHLARDGTARIAMPNDEAVHVADLVADLIREASAEVSSEGAEDSGGGVLVRPLTGNPRWSLLQAWASK